MRLTELALRLIDGVRPDAPAAARDAADAAQRELSAFVTDAARRVHGRYNYLRPQAAADFVHDAPGHMTAVLIERFGSFYAAVNQANDNRSDDPAAGFLYTAVANHYVTVARRRVAVQPTPVGAAADDDGAVNPLDRLAGDGRRRGRADAMAALDADDFWSAPFPPADRRAIAAWRPIDAAVLLLLSGLHTKVSPADWRATLAQCGVTADVPSPAAADLPDAKRRDRLAVELGITRNGMDQIWSRKRGWLAELTFVARVRRDHPGRGAA